MAGVGQLLAEEQRRLLGSPSQRAGMSGKEAWIASHPRPLIPSEITRDSWL
jgi:hypothetical protein